MALITPYGAIWLQQMERSVQKPGRWPASGDEDGEPSWTLSTSTEVLIAVQWCLKPGNTLARCSGADKRQTVHGRRIPSENPMNKRETCMVGCANPLDQCIHCPGDARPKDKWAARENMGLLAWQANCNYSANVEGNVEALLCEEAVEVPAIVIIRRLRRFYPIALKLGQESEGGVMGYASLHRSQQVTNLCDLGARTRV